MKLKINDIVLDKDLIMREELDSETIDNYTECFEQLPPIVVYETEEQGMVLADGFHRLHAAKKLGIREIEVVIKKGDYRDATEYAALANLKHGKALTRKEKRKVIETMLKLRTERSDRWIAEDIGISSHTVESARERLELGVQIAHLNELIGKDGKTYPREIQKTIEKKEEEKDPLEGKMVCGDALGILTDGGFITNNSCDLIYVDPPYSVLGEDWDKWNSKEEFLAFTKGWLSLVVPKMKTTGRLYVSFAQDFLYDLLGIAKDFDKLVFGNIIIWNRRNVFTKPRDNHRYIITYEPVVYFRGKDAEPLNFSQFGEEQGDVWQIAVPQSNFKEDKKIHPAQKPLELLERIIRTGSKRGDLIFDPFAGVGTTGVAAWKLARDFRLVENEEIYFNQARERILSHMQEKK